MTKMLWFYVPYTLLLLWGFLTYFSGQHGDFVLTVNTARTPFWDAIMPFLTHLGDGIFFAIITIVFLIHKRKVGITLTILGLIQLLVSYVLKRQIFRGTPRPKTYFEELGVNLSFLENVRVHSWNSFPSGHTLTAFALAIFLSRYYGRGWLAFLLLVTASVVAFSRVYLLQHFLIDICVGSIVGATLGEAVYQTSKRYFPTKLK